MDDQLEPIVVATDVTKVYRSGDLEVTALRGATLTINSGELLAVTGPSGNGKSTLLNCLSGLDTIDNGTVEIEGMNIHSMSDRERTAHRAHSMGFVFQSFNLIPVLTAAENVELPLLAAKVDARTARKRAEAMLERVELDNRMTHRPAELSGGQQQRVAIARALVGEPAIIWADEPTGNLDSNTADTIAELLQQVNEAGQTVVIVTHNRDLASMASREVEVTDGRVNSTSIAPTITSLPDTTSRTITPLTDAV